MEAAARSPRRSARIYTVGIEIPSRRAKRTRIEAAASAGSHLRRTTQIPSRRAKRTNFISALLPCSNNHHRSNLDAKQAQISSQRGLVDDLKRQGPNWCPKRARTGRRCPLDPDNNNCRDSTNLDDVPAGPIDLPCPPDNNNWRDWANLADGPAGHIAERVLAYDVADYVRFRAVCRPWRQCSPEPRTHSGLDRRFHPWRWTMLQEEEVFMQLDRRFFLNTSTGECLQVDIPELRDHELLAVTPEGLIVLVHKRTQIRLLNPLTRHLTELPPLTTLLPPEDHDELSGDNTEFYLDFVAWGSGIANDDSTFVLCFSRLRMIGIAKPGDDRWTLLRYAHGTTSTSLTFAGRFYCVSLDGLMVLQLGADHPPQLQVAAEIDIHVSLISDSLHLVDNYGELMLVHCRGGSLSARNELFSCCDVYRVDLGTGTLLPVKRLGGSAGHAVFVGMFFSLVVSLDAFPFGSLSADTIYFSRNVSIEVGAYHLVDGSSESPRRYNYGSVPRPHTLVDCLCLSVTL